MTTGHANSSLHFIMEFKFNFKKPKRSRAWFSAITMGLSYLIGKCVYFPSHYQHCLSREGGLLPMIPYFVTKDVTCALFVSIGITTVILILFGFIKNYVNIKTTRSGLIGAIETLSVGAIAAGASYGVVYGIDHSGLH